MIFVLETYLERPRSSPLRTRCNRTSPENYLKETHPFCMLLVGTTCTLASTDDVRGQISYLTKVPSYLRWFNSSRLAVVAEG